LVSMLSKVLVPTFRLVGKVIGLILSPLSAIREMFIALTTEGAGGLVDKFRELGPIVSGIGLVLTAIILPSLLTGAVSLARMVITAGFWALKMIAGAIASVVSANAMTLGIGALAIAAGIGVVMVAMNSGMGKAGDLNSPADGKTQVSTKEGGLYELSKNDDIMAAPGLSDRLTTKKTNGLAKPAEGGIGGLLGSIGDYAGSVAGAFNGSNRIIEKLDELIVAVGGSRDVYMDKEKVSSSVVKTNEKSGENRFGLMGA
jgi:hypothetical protein